MTLKPALQRVAIYVTDLLDQAPAKYIAVVTSTGMGTQAFYVDAVAFDRAGVAGYREGSSAPVFQVSRHAEVVVYRADLAILLTQEARLRAASQDAKAMKQLARELDPEGLRAVEAGRELDMLQIEHALRRYRRDGSLGSGGNYL